MILLAPVVAGLLVSLARARFRGEWLTIPALRLAWLVPVAYLPQFLAFDLPATRNLISDDLARACLVASQVLLSLFAAANLKHPGFWALGLGLLLNLLVTAWSGGFMPISPTAVAVLLPDAPAGTWQIGSRLGKGTDIILPDNGNLLAFLSDRWLLPDWIPYRVAFSLGDVFIALGAFWFLASLGARKSGKGSAYES